LSCQAGSVCIFSVPPKQETLYLFSTRANAVHILRGLAEAREGAAQPIELEALAARFDVQADG
jgi:hypothetical protein